MSLDNIRRALGRPKYSLIFSITALVVGGFYRLLNDPEAFDATGWAFAVLFPILVGLTVALQWYNRVERSSCPAAASSGGVLGGAIGLITVACPACPSVLLSWLGLTAGAAGGVLGAPWIKLGSFVVLAWSLHRAAR